MLIKSRICWFCNKRNYATFFKPLPHSIALHNANNSQIQLKKWQEYQTQQWQQLGSFPEMQQIQVFESKNKIKETIPLYKRIKDVLLKAFGKETSLTYGIDTQLLNFYLLSNQLNEASKILNKRFQQQNNYSNLHQDTDIQTIIWFHDLELLLRVSLLLNQGELVNQLVLSNANKIPKEFSIYSEIGHFLCKKEFNYNIKTEQSAFASLLYYSLEALSKLQCSEKYSFLLNSSLDTQRNLDSLIHKHVKLLDDPGLKLEENEDLNIHASCNIAELYCITKDYEKAMNLISSAFTLLNKRKERGENNQNFEFLLARALGIGGTIYYKTEQAIHAEGLFNSCFDIFQKHKVQDNVLLKHLWSNNLLNYGNLLNDWDKREKQGKENQAISQKMKQDILTLVVKNQCSYPIHSFFYLPL